MNKEEQEAIEYLRDLRYGEINDNYKKAILNYISKLEKENDILKLLIKDILNEFGFQTERYWRKFEKLEEENE